MLTRGRGWVETIQIAAVRMLSVRQLKTPNRRGDTRRSGGVGQMKFITCQRGEEGTGSIKRCVHCKNSYPTATSNFSQADKASILDEAIEYLKSLQMQLQIMWMTTGVAPMMFPGVQQFMPPMAVGLNSAFMPAAQGLNQMPRVPYMNHPLPNHISMKSSPAMNAMYVANQMQNIHLREASNHFHHPNGGQAETPQVPGPYAYAPQVAQNWIPEVPDSTVVPTSGAGQPPTSGGI